VFLNMSPRKEKRRDIIRVGTGIRNCAKPLSGIRSGIKVANCNYQKIKYPSLIYYCGLGFLKNQIPAYYK
jgi:hypothetical protein